MSKNWSLIREVLQQIQREPERWDQNTWAKRDLDNPACGTSMCFAGWATHLVGAQLVFEDAEDRYAIKVMTKTGGIKWIPTHAEHLLGLTDDEGSALFRGDNTEEDLAEIVLEWACADNELRDEVNLENQLRDLQPVNDEIRETVSA